MQQEFPKEEARKNVEYLSTIAGNILTVLFNVFTYTVADSRGFVLETIETYLNIIPKDELATTFDKVCGMLKQAMDEEAGQTSQQQQQQSKTDIPSTSITMMDLIVAMAKYVPESLITLCFLFCCYCFFGKESINAKRAYRIISRLAETETGKQSILKFIEKLKGFD